MFCWHSLKWPYKNKLCKNKEAEIVLKKQSENKLKLECSAKQKYVLRFFFKSVFFPLPKSPIKIFITEICTKNLTLPKRCQNTVLSLNS